MKSLLSLITVHRNHFDRGFLKDKSTTR